MSEEIPLQRRYLVRRPVALQWFEHHEEGGMTLRRRKEEGERVSARFELFLDLLCEPPPKRSNYHGSAQLTPEKDVALVANFADTFTENPNGNGLVKYILTFTPAWHAWGDAKNIANTYFNDDILQRLSILWVMALLVLYGNNATLVDEEIDALRATAAVYIVMRFTQYFAFAMFTLASPYHRFQNRFYAGFGSIALLIYIPLFFEGISLRSKVAVAAVGIAWEELAFLLSYGPFLKRSLNLKYSTALDINHESDRSAAFYTIVLGEFLYYIVVGSNAAIGLNIRAMRAVWTLVIAFTLNWVYSASDGSIRSTHPIRRDVWTAWVWIVVHLPLSAALLIGGHICAIAVYEEELESGQRWMWGGGLALGYLILWIHAAVTRCDDPPGLLVMPKYMRIAPRLVIALVFVLLPLADDEELNPTQMLSIGAGMSVFLLVWETVGGLVKGAALFENWRDTEDERLELFKSTSWLSRRKTGSINGEADADAEGAMPKME